MGKRLKFVNLALFISTLMTCLVGSSAWILAEEVNMSNRFNTGSSVPIAYNDRSGERYYQIERAVNDASAGDNIYVIPSSIKGRPTIYTITENVIIKSGVNLILPYENTTVNNGTDNWPNGKIFFADENEAQVKEYRRTSITVDDDVKITIEKNAGLQIGGFTGNESPKGLTGHTSGSYTEFVLNPGAIIDCRGTINCYGYIKEGKKVDNGSIIYIRDGASLLEPFVIYDFKGGSISVDYVGGFLGSGDQVCPFDIFDIPNVQSKLRVEHGGTIIGDVKAEMTTKIFEQINVVSKSDAPLLLTKGSIDLKYSNRNTSSEPYKYTNYYLDINDERVYTNTDVPVVTNGSYTKNNANLNQRIVASLNENSTMDVNYINISLMAISSIDSRKFFFPLCYIYQISVENNAVLNVQYDAKFLWGSSLTIEEGGLLNVNADLVFYTANNSINNVIATDLRNAKYNRLMGYPNVSSIGDATLINNGQINVSAGQSLSGNIISNKSDAILLTKNVQSKCRDVSAFDGSSMTEYKHDLYGNLLILNNGEYELTENGIFAESNKVYTSKLTSNEKYAWSELINDAVVRVAQQDSEDEWKENYKMFFTITDSITNVTTSYNYSSFEQLENIGIIDQSSVNYTFKVLMGQITINGQIIDESDSVSFTGEQLADNTIYIKPAKAKYTLAVSKAGGDRNPTVVINFFMKDGTSTGTITTETLTSSSQYNYYLHENEAFTVEAGSDCKEINVVNATAEENGMWIGSGENLTINIKATGTDACFETGTIIETNHGPKAVEDLTKDDLILSFNHFTGVYEYKSIALLVDHGRSRYQVMELYFDDGSYIGFIYNHGLFDVTLNKYVDFTIDNFESYVGHQFIKYENGQNKYVKLIDAKLVEKTTNSYTVISSGNLNCVGNGLLNTTTILYGIYNIFDYDNNHIYDSNSMQNDILKYGEYSYDDFKNLITKDVFDDYGFAYFKVSIGKGYMTYDILIGYIKWLYDLIESGEAIIY